ncbi:kinase-like domain-containing protein [Rhizophagus irregularis DAOM 181602=DAOM 197198]|nr:kinase-like domain-containing protein [Rhizophagus irregularis DAOM 181602=DAOM 197198]
MFSQNIPLPRNNILKQHLETNFTNWTSGNEKINNFIQERQLKIINYGYDIVLEWIPYNQFNEIKETGKNGLITVYSAIWKDGPLYKTNILRNSNNKVALKCLHNSQESIDSLINEAKKYPTKHEAFQVLYGISQNPNTGDYILVQSNTINLSGNEKIDDFIQERQLKVNNYDDVVFEWIPYNQFNKIKETSKDGLITVYSAMWKDGPLYKKNRVSNYTRDSNKKVALKCLHNLQESVDSLINEAKKYPTKHEAFQWK